MLSAPVAPNSQMGLLVTLFITDYSPHSTPWIWRITFSAWDEVDTVRLWPREGVVRKERLAEGGVVTKEAGREVGL